jgi:hypothetical protein
MLFIGAFQSSVMRVLDKYRRKLLTEAKISFRIICESRYENNQ